MSTPVITPPAAPQASTAARSAAPATAANQPYCNAYGQWCTRGLYGCWQPHPSLAHALAVLANEEVG